MTIEIKPVTRQRWADMERLFGPNRVTAGCWCMWWRQRSSEFAEKHNESKRRAMRRIVSANRVPGVLAYVDGEPVGWCSVAPREEFGKIERSRTLGPIDDRPVWSIVCFFIHRKHRGAGVGTALLKGAVDLARKRGAEVIEAYPVDTSKGRVDSGSVFTGTLSMFKKAGFREVARRSAHRPIVRLRA